MISDESIVDYLCRNICGKKILYVTDLTWLHTPKYIITHSWQAALHEVSHWIVCDTSCRTVYNLGLPEVDTEIPFYMYDRMYSEECMAIIVNKLLLDKYFKTNADEDLMYKSEMCAKTINKDYIQLYNNALALFEYHTNSIIINNGLIFKLKIKT